MQRYDIFYTLQTFLTFIFEKKVPCSHTYLKKCKFKGVDSLIRGLYCIHIVFWYFCVVFIQIVGFCYFSCHLVIYFEKNMTK